MRLGRGGEEMVAEVMEVPFGRGAVEVIVGHRGYNERARWKGEPWLRVWDGGWVSAEMKRGWLGCG